MFCRPASAGGSGDSSPPTAAGVRGGAARAVRVPAGAGPAGGPVVRGGRGWGTSADASRGRWPSAGAALVVGDVDPAKEALARSLGAAWVIAGVGGHGRRWTCWCRRRWAGCSPRRWCRAALRGDRRPGEQPAGGAVGGGAARRARLLWLPDPLVSAGGVIYGTGRELRGQPHDEAMARVRAIGDLVTGVLATADDQRIPVRPRSTTVTSRLLSPH